MPNVPDKDLPAWALDNPGPPRGQFPVELVFGSTDKDGNPDDEARETIGSQRFRRSVREVSGASREQERAQLLGVPRG